MLDSRGSRCRCLFLQLLLAYGDTLRGSHPGSHNWRGWAVREREARACGRLWRLDRRAFARPQRARAARFIEVHDEPLGLTITDLLTVACCAL